MSNEALTREQAVALYKAEFWKDLTHRQRAEFQLRARALCMPFEVFHEAIESALGRPVMTHEFGFNWDGLEAEMRGERPAPTFQEVLDMIPEGQRILIRI